MDLERSLNNISIDDGPWRHDQPQQVKPPVWGNGGMPGGNAQPGWGHMSPQQQMRSLWQDPNALAQGVNEALGLNNGASNQGWGNPMPAVHSEYDQQKIWADPLAEPHYAQIHPHSRGMNGMVDQPGADWGNQRQPGAQPIWSDNINKDPDHYWKQQPQQPQAQWGAPPGAQMGGGWPQRQMGPMSGPPPPHQTGGPRGGPMMHQQGGWQPNGMMRQQKPMPWNDQQRMPGMPQRGRPQPQQSRFPPQNMGAPDVSVPPPIGMPHMPQQGMNMRQVPMPGPQGWKPNQMGGGPGGGGRPPMMQNMWDGGSAGNSKAGMWESPKEVPYHVREFPISGPDDFPIGGHDSNFPIGGPDDLMWHDPNGDLKKWQRDTGVSNWGDPEKYNERSIRFWIIGEGEEEDLESALLKCPVPQKKSDDGTSRFPFPVPQKRPIVVTGWGELPENDPNNPGKNDEPAKWSDVTTGPNDAPWFLPGQPAPFANNADSTGTWVQGGTIPLNDPSSNSNTQHAVAEMLKYAVDKGYLDISVTMSQNLPPPVLQNVNLLLGKIPALESVEAELKQLVDSARPEGESNDNAPTAWLNEVQKVEYNRLIIEVATAKIEVQQLSKKIQTALVEAGIIQPIQNNVATTSEDYHYSFLDRE